MGHVNSFYFVGLLILAVSSAISSTANADVSGFEHLADISIECGSRASEPVVPRALKGHFLCSYEQRLCKVLNKKELQFEAFISVDCEVKSAGEKCPPITECAKPKQLSDNIAEEVRHLNDPNFAGKIDGAIGAGAGRGGKAEISR